MNNFDQKAENKKILGVLIPGLLLAAIWIWFTHVSGHATAEDQQHHQKSSAYYAAVDFLKEKYPGAKNCAPEEQTSISDKGDNHWAVGVKVEGVNSFNAPIIKFITVEMLWRGNNSWSLERIDQW